jgi:predicted amidohydrolase YtcJ
LTDGVKSAPLAPISLVIVNARVWTANPRRPWADAVAVRGDRLAAVSSGAEVRKIAGDARVIDAGAAMLVPGSLGALVIGGRETGAATTLERGGMADFVLLDRALPDVTPISLGTARARLIVVAGRVVGDETNIR